MLSSHARWSFNNYFTHPCCELLVSDFLDRRENPTCGKWEESQKGSLILTHGLGVCLTISVPRRGRQSIRSSLNGLDVKTRTRNR